MAKTTTIAVDLAKNVFEVSVSHRAGHVAEHHRLRRARFLEFFAGRPPATVLLEACGSAHDWGRKITALGHRVRLLPPRKVKKYADTQKTDRTDTLALLEAHRNRRILPVPIKTIEQQTLAWLHRARSGWMHARTARLNFLRGVLRELGEVIPVGATKVVPRVLELVEDADSCIPMALRSVLAEHCQELRELERKIDQVAAQLDRLGREIPAVLRLRTVPGIGPLTSTALVAFVGDVVRFANGRKFGAYLGLVPKERSSGDTRRLGCITKCGDPYLRMLLIHGARSVLLRARSAPNPDPLAAWARQVEARRGHNKAATALANKLARIAWAVWRHDRDFEARPAIKTN